MTTDPLAFKRRHPFCPECGYDLVGTVASDGRVCPECGFAFTPADLRRELREGDWTLLRGMRSLALALIIRMLWLIPLWAAALAALSPVFGFLTQAVRVRTYGVLALILFIPACVIGHVLSRNAVELMGCATLIAYVMVGAAALGVVYAGVAIAGIWSLVPGGFEGYIVFATSAAATLWAVYQIFDES